MPNIAILCRQARVGNWVADREMVDDLSLMGGEIEVPVHLIIVESADAGGPQPECFCREIEPLADSARFKMHVAVSTIAMRANGTVEIGNHREGDAGITGEILPEAQTGSGYTLVTAPDRFQRRIIRPQPVYTGLQAVDPVRIEVELYPTCAREIRGERLACGGEDARELGKRHGMRSTLEVER